MIKIIGTTHLMPKEEIYALIEKENPDIIGVELCETRHSLLVKPIINNQEDFKANEDKSLVGQISNKIKEKAEKEGLQYGSDMINACLYAEEKNLQLSFLDLDITKTKYLMEHIPKEEQEIFQKEMIEFQKKSLKEQTGNIDEEKMLLELKEKCPIAFEFLVNMRNIVIINNLLKLKLKYPNKKIVCLLGKGHTKAIEGALNE